MSDRELKIGTFKGLARTLGYQLYTRPYELNIWGVRKNSAVPNAFDDSLYVFFRNPDSADQKWTINHYFITTDPGTFWLQNPMMPQGTAILKANQYVDQYEIGLHRRKYYAVVQKDHIPVSVIRDYNRDATLDFFNGSVDHNTYGINIHRARKSGDTPEVQEYSAGCQVFKNGEDFAEFMKLAERHRSLFSNSFTYTLIDQRARARLFTKRLAIGASFLGLSSVLYLLYNQFTQSQEV